ncbi:MAG: hypothetical protein QOI66_4909 [Myxococcales bacterium]|nr:hypothetical protein [Myxococcales bacterium]
MKTNSRATSWHGQEVTDESNGQAEAAADRAAGRGPGRPPEADLSDDDGVEPVQMTPEESAENLEEKRRAAAEDHERDRKEGRGTAPKNL